MHCHLYRVSTSLLPILPNTPPPLHEYNTLVTYEYPSTIPVISTTVHTIPGCAFRVVCRRDGDASDAGVGDIAFDAFVDGVWIGACYFRAGEIKVVRSGKVKVLI